MTQRYIKPKQTNQQTKIIEIAEPPGTAVEVYTEACKVIGCKVNSSLRAALSVPTECISHIDLNTNIIGPKGVKALLPVLPLCPSLVSFRAAANNLTNESVMEVLRVLERHSIEELDFSQNPISHLAGKRISSYAATHASVRRINVSGTFINAGLVTIIEARVRINIERHQGLQSSSGISVSLTTTLLAKDIPQTTTLSAPEEQIYGCNCSALEAILLSLQTSNEGGISVLYPLLEVVCRLQSKESAPPDSTAPPDSKAPRCSPPVLTESDIDKVVAVQSLYRGGRDRDVVKQRREETAAQKKAEEEAAAQKKTEVEEKNFLLNYLLNKVQEEGAVQKKTEEEAASPTPNKEAPVMTESDIDKVVAVQSLYRGGRDRDVVKQRREEAAAQKKSAQKAPRSFRPMYPNLNALLVVGCDEPSTCMTPSLLALRNNFSSLDVESQSGGVSQ